MHQGRAIFSQISGMASQIRIREVCPSLPGESSTSEIQLLRPSLVPGFRTAHITIESSRRRDMSPLLEAQALSCRVQGEVGSEHAGRCKRKEGLEDLRRFCPGTCLPCSKAQRRGNARCRLGASGLRLGFYNHRPGLVAFSLGQFPQTKSSNQASHPPVPPRERPPGDNPSARQGPRCEHPRPTYV